MNNENEHDFTKMMLEAIRKSKSSLLKENEDAGASFNSETSQVPTNSSSTNNNISNNNETPSFNDNNEEVANDGLDTPEGKEEASKIGEMVDPLINVDTFKIYNENGNVVMTGNFQNADISWQFSKNDGLFINAKNVNLTDNVKEMINKLSSYYVNWQKDWASKIGEYIKNK
jgi:hypothetical protein